MNFFTKSTTIPTTTPTADAASVAPPVSATKSNQTAYGLIEQLAADRKAWQEGAFRTSNEQLYVILRDCYKMYLDMCKDTAASKLLRETLARYIAENKISVKDSAHTLVKIVRCVFGNDRRRVSAYGIVLRAAYAAKVIAEDLPAYIRDNGGVEEVRLAKSPSYVSPKGKAEVAANWLADVNLATVKSDALSVKLDAANIGSKHVLVVTQQADGSLTANAFISSQSVVTSALSAFYSEHKQQAKTAEAVAEVAKVSGDLTDAIKVAAEQAAQQAA